MRLKTGIVALLMGFTSVTLADELLLGEAGPLFDGKNLKIKWNVATNDLPSKINVYKVVPAKFSLQTISNFVAISGLSEQTRIRSGLLPALNGKDCQYHSCPPGI